MPRETSMAAPVSFIRWFGPPRRSRVASTAIDAHLRRLAAYHLPHPKSLGQPTQRRSPPADQAASGDIFRIAVQLPTSGWRVLGCSWQTLLHFFLPRNIELRQILDDLCGNQFARAQLGSASCSGDAIVDTQMA